MKFIIFYYFVYILYFVFFQLFFSGLHINFLNVGQGDSIYVKSKSTFALIDGGPDYSADYFIDNQLPFFNCNLTYIVATHPHKDHIAGLQRILKRCKVDYVVINKVDYSSNIWNDFLNSSTKNSNLVSHLDFPTNLILDYKISFKALHFSQCIQDVNECSILTEFSFFSKSLNDNFTAVLTGDLYHHNVSNLYSGPVDLFKVPHHGGKGTLSNDLITDLKPKLAVLTYGLNNRYSHPHLETVNILESMKIPYRSTVSNNVLVKVPE